MVRICHTSIEVPILTEPGTPTGRLNAVLMTVLSPMEVFLPSLNNNLSTFKQIGQVSSEMLVKKIKHRSKMIT